MQSINDIIGFIRDKDNSNSTRISMYIIENKGVIENFKPIDIFKLESIIRNLPNKKGTDEGITGNILRHSFYVRKEKFVRLINESLSKGVFPEEWKTSTVIPILKVGKPRKASKYRPINTLPTYKKMLELVVEEYGNWRNIYITTM